MNKQKLIDIFEKHNPRTPMSEDESNLMINIMMSKDPSLSIDITEMDKKSENYQHFKPIIESFQAQVFLSRLKHMTSLKISLGALLILMNYMESPGKVVMFVFYLFYKLPANKLIDVNTIIELFPWGFFSEEQLNEIWNAQKVGKEESEGFSCIGAPDNMIDYLETWN